MRGIIPAIIEIPLYDLGLVDLVGAGVYAKATEEESDGDIFKTGRVLTCGKFEPAPDEEVILQFSDSEVVKHIKTDSKGRVTDISTDGCRFVIKLPASLQPRQIMLIDRINLCFPLMGLKGIQEFNGKVKNTTIDDEKIAMGIEFYDLDENIVASIGDYIYSVTEISSD